MPDLPGREEIERRLARIVSQQLRGQLNALLELLGDPPDPARLTPEFWAQMSTELRAAVQPELEGIFLTSAQNMLDLQPIGVDWGLANIRAAEWIEGYLPQMILGVNERTRQFVAQELGDFFRRPTTLETLRMNLMSLLGPVRADLIASTETTRAAVQGELMIVNELRSQGAVMKPIWQTSADERVCPICQPRDGMVIGVQIANEYPPAHPRCRCWVNHEFVVEGV